MYMIEITEDKLDNVLEHIGKSIKCLTKVAECIEEMRAEGYEPDDDDEREKYEYGGHGMSGGSSRRRYARGGRYSRY